MTDPMTPERLAEIEARAEAATKGPWWWGTPDEAETATAAESLLSMLHDPAAHCSTVWSAWTVRDGETVLPAVTGDGPTSRTYAEFIAAARTDVDDLLAEVRRLQAAVERVRELHVPDGEGFCRACDYGTQHHCPTIAALDGDEQ